MMKYLVYHYQKQCCYKYWHAGAYFDGGLSATSFNEAYVTVDLPD